jgi:hypothetical protein
MRFEVLIAIKMKTAVVCSVGMYRPLWFYVHMTDILIHLMFKSKWMYHVISNLFIKL